MISQATSRLLKSPVFVIARRPQADAAIQKVQDFQRFSGSPRLLRSLAMTVRGDRQQAARLFFIVLFVFSSLCFLPQAARAEMTEYPVAKLQSLDKTTARTMTFNARVGSTVKFGPIYIRVQACRKAPPVEKPESAAFLQIWEVTLKEQKPQWIFSGWMYASSPALSPMDHPIYDVWVLDCLEGTGAQEPKQDAAAAAAAKKESKSAADAPVETVIDSEAQTADSPEPAAAQ